VASESEVVMFDPSQHRMDLWGAFAALFVFFVFIGTWWWYGVRLYRARSLVERGAALLVDVDTRETFAREPITGATNIPFAELADRLPELGSRRKKIVVCGRRTLATARATRAIRSFGYRAMNAGAWL
jgi:rhodanese-related sulfurtransferase